MVSNKADLANLFIGTLKGAAFKWFLNPPEGTIHNYSELEKFFLTRFFKDDSESPCLFSSLQIERTTSKDFEELRSTA